MTRINNIEDVFSHFDATFEPDDMERSNALLSRRLYKDTSCGAWARVYPPGLHKVGKRQEPWTCSYRKVDGIWERVMFSFDGERVLDAKVPPAVLEYFWPPGDNGMQEFLAETAEGRSSLDLTETVDVPVMQEHNGMFLVGSIVEGVDAEIEASPVYLPCEAKDLDAAVKFVEDEAASVWDQTHGCDACDLDGAINPACKSCGGDGTVI